jgi:two-component system OmpR family sensor kinase
LTALRGELELAQRRDRSPEEYRRVIGSALEETERIAALTEDLLTLARADAGVMKPRLQRTDLGERASESLKRLQTQAEDRRQRIELDSVGDVVGLLDPDLIDRLIWNLVDNAIKFSSAGSEIRVSVRGSDDELTLVVADTGPGIRDEALDTIFERFSQADSSHSSVEGTGLGLSIVRAIAEAHGGTVTAENRPAGGALFQVRLPRNT